MERQAIGKSRLIRPGRTSARDLPAAETERDPEKNNSETGHILITDTERSIPEAMTREESLERPENKEMLGRREDLTDQLLMVRLEMITDEEKKDS